jgi:hypothetical protein
MLQAPHFALCQVRAEFGPDSVDQSKSKHFTSQQPAEAAGQLNVASWPRSKDSLFANGDENERYLVTSTDLMCPNLHLPNPKPLLLSHFFFPPHPLSRELGRYGHAAGNLRAHDTLWAQSTIKNRCRPCPPVHLHATERMMGQGSACVCRATH